MGSTQINDQWSPLSFIGWLGGDDGNEPVGAPGYLLLPDKRRLRAYEILSAFMTNTRRTYLDDNQRAPLRKGLTGKIIADTPQAKEFREYGDAMLLVETLRDLILGDDQSFVIGDPVEYERQVEAAKNAGEAEPPDPAAPFRAWVEEWLADERFAAKILEAEEKACGLGDVVYVLAVSDKAKRPKLRVYDPGFYFPDTEAVVDGWDDDDFPPRVHLLWEYEDDEKRTWVRRCTWEMVKLDAAVTAPWGGVREWTCMYREVEWRQGDIRRNATVYSEDMGSNARVIVEPQDLEIDFIPVVHVPNTATSDWGRSVLTLLAQLLDDIQSVDSDLALDAQTANPLLVSDAATPLHLSGLPGEQLSLPAGSDAKYINASLHGQIEVVQWLLKRLGQTSRLGDVLLGRIAPNDVPSGYAMALGFHPPRQVMRNARTVREEKYPLLVKFAIRIAQARDWLKQRGPTPAISVVFGSSLPSDVETAVKTVKDLRDAQAISRETGVQVLQDAGLPIDSITQEVERLEAQDVDALVKIVDALGAVGTQEVLRRLGLDNPPTPTQPSVEPPPTE